MLSFGSMYSSLVFFKVPSLFHVLVVELIRIKESLPLTIDGNEEAYISGAKSLKNLVF